MRTLRTISALALVLGMLVAFGARQAAFAAGRYHVYCANGRLEVDSRTLEQMKAARGENVCLMADFDTLAEAEKFASDRGGKGSACKCR